jgi:hypothetical protein
MLDRGDNTEPESGSSSMMGARMTGSTRTCIWEKAGSDQTINVLTAARIVITLDCRWDILRLILQTAVD